MKETKKFTVIANNQWETGFIDLFQIGYHKCNRCDLFNITLFGINLAIGFTTVLE